jgi:hypothetical protein
MNDRAAKIQPRWRTAEKHSANVFKHTYSTRNQPNDLLWVLLHASTLLSQEDWTPTYLVGETAGGH